MLFNKVIISTATLIPETDFFQKTALGRSLAMIMPQYPEIELKITSGSSSGLSYPYNDAIESATVQDMLIFMHDDVYIDDWHMISHLYPAFEHYDVVGVAGSVAREDHQQTWWCCDIHSTELITGERSGQIRHAQQNNAHIINFGPANKRVKLLDGVFIAAKAEALLRTNIRFDPRFKYHFYDLDFSRQCEMAGLRLGTWPIALLHESNGGYGETWHQGRDLYFEKWGS